MLCALEMQRVIETAFLPATCRCVIGPNGNITIHVGRQAPTVLDAHLIGNAFAPPTGEALGMLVKDLNGHYRLQRIEHRRRFFTEV